MHNRRPPLPAIILVLILIAAGIYYGVRSLNADTDGQLAASGTIESVVVNISPEMAGKVTEVLAEEGQLVKVGDLLLHLDDTSELVKALVACLRFYAQRLESGSGRL